MVCIDKDQIEFFSGPEVVERDVPNPTVDLSLKRRSAVSQPMLRVLIQSRDARFGVRVLRQHSSGMAEVTPDLQNTARLKTQGAFQQDNDIHQGRGPGPHRTLLDYDPAGCESGDTVRRVARGQMF